MSENKPVTKKELNKTLNKTLSEFSDAILAGVEKMIGNLRKDMNRGFDELKTGQRDLQRQINDLKADTPTMKEFRELKEKVYYHHPAN